MQNFLKKSFFALTFVTHFYMVPGMEAPRPNLPPGTPKSALPSVAEVFGGLSEQEIAEQVQMGQQFLEDLQKHGTPQEIAEFQRLLEETLNSMSEEDFKDIQAIAQMVEPHIMPSQPEPTAAVASSSSVETTLPAASSDLEEFKKIINTIIQRIDDIFQKINSSKECAEQVDTKWKNKSTFANMKRQIYQLKNDRLAQKLCKKDLKDDDKKLAEYLKTYLKDLTAQNDALVIEDDFGLPASFAEEKKHLKQTKAFLETCDETIDTLMPLLEKFLQKWDPEALQLAKESETRSKKAETQANEATKRQASATAQPKSASSGSGYGYKPTGSDYGSDYGGYYPDYDNYPGSYGYNPYGQTGSEFGSPEGTGSQASNSDQKSAKAKSNEISATAPNAKETTKDKNNLYEFAMSELEGHVKEDFDTQHEEAFINFMQNDIINSYPLYSKISGPGGPLTTTISAKTPTAAATNIPTTTTDAATEGAWIDSKPPFPVTLTSGEYVQGFKGYTHDITNTLEKEFTPEFAPLHTYFDDLKNSIINMSSDELKKLSASKELTAVENRLKRYQKTFEGILPQLEDKFKVNTLPGTANAPEALPGILDKETVPQYRNAHNNFIKELQLKISDEADTLLNKISSIKRSAKRNSTKKSSQKTSTAQ